MRNFSFNCLILSTKTSGENNRNVCIFSEEEGIVYTTLYGGPKSKLKSYISPFNRGKIWIYKDETKNQSKITDFDVEKYHLSFRDSLLKSQEAAVACEIVMKTNCAGNPQGAFFLLNGFLDGLDFLDNSREMEIRLSFFRFLWRYFELLGMKPHATYCCKCEKSFFSGKSSNIALYLNSKDFIEDYSKIAAVYSSSENGFICEDCSDFSTYPVKLNKNALIYLEAVTTLSAKESRNLPLTQEAFLQIKGLCFFILEHIIGVHLKSLQTFGELI